MANPLSVYDIAGRAMSAQLVRLNTTASNLANAGSISSTKESAFRAIKPVFRSVTDAPGVATVRVAPVATRPMQPTQSTDQNNPLAAQAPSPRRAQPDVLERRHCP